MTAEGQARSIPPDAHEREKATMSTRRYDPEAAREELLDSAERLFAAKGFDGVSTAAIAKEAGVSQSQIHYHFETKKRLWDKVFERRFADYFAAQSSLLDNPQMEDMERMRQSIVSYFEFFEKYPHYVRLLTRAQLDLGEDGATEGDPAEEMGEMLMRKGSGVITEAQRAGRIRDDIRPDFAIIGFLSLVAHWFMSGHHLMVETKDEKDREAHDREYLDFIIRVYLRGLAPE